MRTIKFRAWHKQRKEMLPVIDIEYLMTNGSLITNYKDFVDNIYPNIMQFTGLLDKNGVEVFEGDVVKSNSHKPTTFKIEFIEGGFCATQSEHNYPLDINHFYPSTGCMIEVIGNIFQHPHLLEVNQ